MPGADAQLGTITCFVDDKGVIKVAARCGKHDNCTRMWSSTLALAFAPGLDMDEDLKRWLIAGAGAGVVTRAQHMGMPRPTP